MQHANGIWLPSDVFRNKMAGHFATPKIRIGLIAASIHVIIAPKQKAPLLPKAAGAAVVVEPAVPSQA